MMRTCESTIMTILRAVYQKTVFFTYIIGTFYSVFIRIKLDYNQIIGENHVAIVILSIFFFIVFVVFKSFFFKKVRKDICIYVEILVVFYLSILIGLGRNSLLMIAGGAAFTYYNMMNAEGDSGTQLPLPASSGTSSSDSTAKPSPSALDQRADELLEKNIEALKTSLGEGERISEVRETVKDNFDVKTPGEEYELIQNIEGEVHLNEKQCDGEKSINMKSSLNEVTEKRGDCPITITELNEIKNHEALIQYGKGGGPFEVEWGLIRPPAGIRFCPTFGRYYEQTERRLGLISLKKEYVGSRGQPGPVIFWFCFRGFLESLLFIVVRNKVAVGSPTAGLNPSRSTLTME